MANITGTPGTAGSSLGTTGGTSMAGLADWAAPYITNYLGKAQALGEAPYQTYQGPLTAGASDLQTKAFQGIGNLTVENRGTYSPVGSSFTGGNFGFSGQTPQGGFQQDMGTGVALGQSFQNPGNGGLGANYEEYLQNFPEGVSKSPMTFEDYQRVQGQTPSGGIQNLNAQTSSSFQQPKSIAEQYMNPYLQQALDPQLKELQRQSDIARLGDAARLTRAGAFGGSRQAIMESEARRNLLDKQSSVLGQGYANAYDKAMQQFNEDQRRKIQEAQFGADFGLKGLGAERDILNQQLTSGGVQRGITSEGIAADLGEFNAQREFPYKQVQFMRDMISGLPTGSVTNTPAQLSGIAQLITSVGGIDKLLKSTGQGDLGTMLRNLGLNFGGGEVV